MICSNPIHRGRCNNCGWTGNIDVCNKRGKFLICPSCQKSRFLVQILKTVYSVGPKRGQARTIPQNKGIITTYCICGCDCDDCNMRKDDILKKSLPTDTTIR